MRTFYVRPERDEGYGGAGDGTTYENAWNGLESVDWQAMAAGDPAQLWLCGGPNGPGGFMTVFVEWSYFAEATAPRPVPGRESPVTV
jgi:hypothetical protein